MPHRERFVTFVGRVAGKRQQNALSERGWTRWRGISCSTRQAVGPKLTFDMRGCYATSLMLGENLEGIGFGARNKIAHNRSETVSRQARGAARRCRRSLDCARLLGSKDFEGCNAEWRRAGSWPGPTTPPALGCSPAPNNKPPRDLISSWAALIQIQAGFWPQSSRDTKNWALVISRDKSR